MQNISSRTKAAVKLLKFAAAVLGAVYFFPVSCATGVAVGIRAAAWLDARHADHGDTMHSHFALVIEPGLNGQPFQVVRLSELEHLQQRPASFRMTKPSGQTDLEWSHITYQVLRDDGQEQLVEVVEDYHDGDNTIWSRYKATKAAVKPVSSKMMYFGYMFSAFPFAFVFALLVYAAGRFLRRKLHCAETGPAA